MKIKLFFVCIFLSLFFSSGFTQVPPSIGGLERIEKDIEKKKELEERIIKEKEKEEEFVIEEEKVPLEEEKKILINKIEVRGVTLISQEIINGIIFDYQGKELSLKDMRKICDLITDEYRKIGYLTSRAYLPPQTIKDGLLVIMVIEGKVGEISIQGNRFFKTPLLKKNLKIKPGQIFDYGLLQKSIRIINEHPDRFVKAVLVPGKETGITDIVLDVKDNLPLHFGFDYDNFGSTYIDKDRYSVNFEHNNLLGYDDRLNIKLQRSQADYYQLKNFNYLFPIYRDWNIGGYYGYSKNKLGGDYEDLDIRGKSRTAGLFFNHRLINEYNLDLTLNFGFDYKHILNYIAGERTSRDEVRLFKLGVDIDNLDKFGRTIFTIEGDLGVPHILGGVSSKDPYATREGAGGKFSKLVTNIYRLHPLPLSSSLLLKNQFQFSNYNLLSVEQFQIGGITNVRGYPSAEYSGDKGLSTSVEWSFPFYGIPKTTRVPFSKATVYSATRFMLFYDWATTHLNRVLAGEKKHQTLKGWGFGVRLNLPENFYARVEFAYPLGKTPSDSDHLHTYLNLGKSF
ncbi:MAG: BamA/TamA family outer membrane protein [Candidatus Omnitrophica bacterium]|nr:BamA/TamA family outer membrane protein [Candidatus Omnitrophota bacterium]